LPLTLQACSSYATNGRTVASGVNRRAVPPHAVDRSPRVNWLATVGRLESQHLSRQAGGCRAPIGLLRGNPSHFTRRRYSGS